MVQNLVYNGYRLSDNTASKNGPLEYVLNNSYKSNPILMIFGAKNRYIIYSRLLFCDR